MVAEAIICVTLMVLVMSTTADFRPSKHGNINQSHIAVLNIFWP